MNLSRHYYPGTAWGISVLPPPVGGGRICRPLPSLEPMVENPARRRLKVIHEFSPKHSWDFKIDLKPRVKVRSNVIFLRFCILKPRAGNIDSFCSNISQNSLKGLVRIPCEHKCHSKYGTGSRSGHERSPESIFAGMQHMIYGIFWTQNSKI